MLYWPIYWLNSTETSKVFNIVEKNVRIKKQASVENYFGSLIYLYLHLALYSGYCYLLFKTGKNVKEIRCVT
jgi:hypothetical protein